MLFRPRYTEAQLFRRYLAFDAFFPASILEPIAYFSGTRSAVMLNPEPLQNVSLLLMGLSYAHLMFIFLLLFYFYPLNYVIIKFA